MTPKTREEVVQFSIIYREEELVFQVDKIDGDLADLQWHVINSNGNIYLRKKPKTLHRIILERKLGRELLKGERSDHKNRDTFDNTRKNLRLATASQNGANTLGHNTKYPHGVSKGKRSYEAIITVEGKRKYIGTFETPEEAHEAFKKRHVEIHGEFSPYWES